MNLKVGISCLPPILFLRGNHGYKLGSISTYGVINMSTEMYPLCCTLHFSPDSVSWRVFHVRI